MQCLQCHTRPWLEWVEERREPTKKTVCRGCGYNFKMLHSVWSCTTCKDYTVCSNCKLCPQSHFMTKCFDLSNKVNYGGANRYNCNYCQASPASFPFVWHCYTCNWDICHHHLQLPCPGLPPGSPKTEPESAFELEEEPANETEWC